MTVYAYKARDRTGAMVTGTMSAANPDQVGVELMRKGHFPVRIYQDNPDEGKEKKRRLFEPKITTQDLVLFTRQMATLFNAGIPILGILGALGEQVANERLRDVLDQMRRDIEDGLALSEAMEKHPDAFSELFISMIQAGEAGGVMDEILVRLADLIEKQSENEAKIKAAMRYPKIVTSAMAIAIVILMWKVVPVFMGMFEKAKLELPLATRILIASHDAFTKYWYYGFAMIGATIFAFKKYTSTEKGRKQWDYILLKAPLFGPILLRSALAKFARILGTLQRGGVPILEILNSTSRVVDNVILEEIILNLRTSVQEGFGLAAPLKTSGFIPPLVIQMIAAGEDSGSLDEMMIKVADYYDEEVDRAVKAMSAMIEPIMMVFMGGLVLFLALAIFVPMWDMSKMAKK